MYQGKRYAIVRGYSITAEKVAAYLPANYKVIHTGMTHTVLEETVVVIEGIDRNGFTLDRYVSPRLGSGLMRCDEIDLSHPIMKEIPA